MISEAHERPGDVLSPREVDAACVTIGDHDDDAAPEPTLEIDDHDGRPEGKDDVSPAGVRVVEEVVVTLKEAGVTQVDVRDVHG
mgnify:CR=1 FL=1